MILTATFEAKDVVPPKLWEQCRAALAATLGLYGFQPTIREDASSELDAHQRFWEWREKERAKAP